MDSSNSKQRKAAYQWAHVGTGDMMKQAIGHNVPRIRAQQQDPSKPGPMPVIARDEKTFKDLTHSRKQILAQAEQDLISSAKTHNNVMMLHQTWKEQRQIYKKTLDPNYVPKGDPTKPAKSFDKSILKTLGKDDLDAYTKATSEKKFWKSQIDVSNEHRRAFADKRDAVINTNILKASDVRMDTLDPKKTKLYVIGHGTAGADYISPTHSTSDSIPLSDVASGLAKSGLSPDFEDVRLTSCHSADITKPMAFNPSFDPPGSSGGLFGYFKSRAPAQVLANEMAKSGFKNPRVTGYQGVGKTEPTGTHQLRKPNSTSPESSEVRASTVKKAFTPEK